MTTVFLTNVGLTDSGNGVGTDPTGKRVEFVLTDDDRFQLSRVLYSDLAVNFSGVEVDTTDLVKEGT